MFCNKTSNNQINQIHKRTLRLVYEVEVANFEDLQLKDNSWNVHENNIHTLLTEIFKSINNLGPRTMKYFFDLNIEDFKKHIKDWKLTTCSCKLCL